MSRFQSTKWYWNKESGIRTWELHQSVFLVSDVQHKPAQLPFPPQQSSVWGPPPRTLRGIDARDMWPAPQKGDVMSCVTSCQQNGLCVFVLLWSISEHTCYRWIQFNDWLEILDQSRSRGYQSPLWESHGLFVSHVVIPTNDSWLGNTSV